MYQEFFFTPEALRVATREAIAKACAYLLAVFLAMMVYQLSGVTVFEPGSVMPTLLIFVVLFTVLIIGGAKKRVQGSRIYITPEGLHFTLRSIKMIIPFAEILKVTVSDAGRISVYSKHSPLFSVINFRNLNAPAGFLNLLRPHAPVYEISGTPWQSRLSTRLIFSFLFLFLLFAGAAPVNQFLFILLNLLLVLVLISQLYLLIIFRRIYWSTASMIIFILLLFLAIGRLMAGPQFFYPVH